MSVRFSGLCEVPPPGLPELIALKAFGFDESGVCVGVWLKGMYFWPIEDSPSMPAGLLREWLCWVLDREGGCDDWAYCCALVWMGCGCMLVAEPGAPELDVALTFAPAPGWRAPGTLLMPALEGSTLAGWEEGWLGVAWWRLNCGGLLA